MRDSAKQAPVVPEPWLRGTLGEKQLPTALGGLLVHVADHAQRHAGHAVTTAKLLLAARSRPSQE
jgi:hypothetical protein